MYRKFLSNLLKFSPLIGYSAFKSFDCFFSKSTFKQNKIENRIFFQVQESNHPCQDRHDFQQLQSIDAFAAAVFDGHGGWQSELCGKAMIKKLDECIKKNLKKDPKMNPDHLIRQSLKEAYLEIQSQYLTAARQGYRFGFGRMGRVGSCALTCVVFKNKVYCANVGDSLGLLIEDKDNFMNFTQINRQLNANNEEQQKRLKALFPEQPDIVYCKNPQTKSCYVKGRLQPTRAIGDLRLKFGQFNNPQQYSRSFDFQPPLKVFTGPYITAEPQIKIFPLNKNHKAIILASDGLWDEMGRQEVSQYFNQHKPAEIPNLLIDKCLEKAAKNHRMSVTEVRRKKKGEKRNIHDDITIVIMNLQNQFSQ